MFKPCCRQFLVLEYYMNINISVFKEAYPDILYYIIIILDTQYKKYFSARIIYFFEIVMWHKIAILIIELNKKL